MIDERRPIGGMRTADRAELEGLAERLQTSEIRGVSIDSRTVRPGELFVAIRGDRFDGHDFVAAVMEQGAWGAVVERAALGSRHGALKTLRNMTPVEDTLLALQELARMHRMRFAIPVIAVTGTNGKTTTKEMLAAVLRQRGPVLKTEGNLNNHIGAPLTLLQLKDEHRAAVIEMGMSGLGEIGLLTRLAQPSVGIITNIGPAHLQFLGSLDAVAQAKGELLQGMTPDGTAVLNADDRYFEALRARFAGRTLSFGVTMPADVRAADIVQRQDGTLFQLHTPKGSCAVRLRAVGVHNVANALAAAAAALAVGLSLDEVRSGLEEFRPTAMRTEVRELGGRTVLADCYNANPASMQAALQALIGMAGGRRAIAVLGDMLELGDASDAAHREVGAAVARSGAVLLIAVGALGRLIAEGARQAGMDPERVLTAETTGSAAVLLRDRSRTGDVVLVKGSRGMRMETILEGF